MDFSHHPSPITRLDEARLVPVALSTPGSAQIARHVSGLSSERINSPPSRHQTSYQVSHAHRQVDLGSKPQLESLGSNKSAQRRPTSARPSPRGLGSSQSYLRRPVKQNPFVVADQATSKPNVVSRVEQSSVHGTRYQKLSQINKNDPSHEVSCTAIECDDPMCRATHDGHYPYRHSIACALHRSEVEGSTTSPEGLPASDLVATTHPPKSQSIKSVLPALDKIVHRHHSRGFHDSHHIIEHLTSGMSHRSQELYTDHVNKSSDESSSVAAKPRGHPSTHLEPLTPVKPLTRVNSTQYVQEVLPHSHPTHDEHSQSTRAIKHSPEKSPPDVRRTGEPNSSMKTEQIGLSTKSTEHSNVTCEGSKTDYFNLKQSHKTYGTTSQSRDFSPVPAEDTAYSGRIYKDDRDLIDDHIINGSKAVHEKTNPVIAKGVAEHARSKPQSRVLSPPPWLKAPSKEAGDAKSRLRHVETKRHEHSSDSHVTGLREKGGKRPGSSISRIKPARDSFDKFITSSPDLLRSSAPSPPTAWHVTQHQRPES
ncbi:hypothetical protein F4819DRAFT_489 [Hypoxylon fuscum]|nr:hypothetical protein F4819DRAFT_489 [Hypoxylon fuscum]